MGFLLLIYYNLVSFGAINRSLSGFGGVKMCKRCGAGSKAGVVVRDVAGPNLDRGFGFKIRTKSEPS